jgi:hypothetical protein
MRTRSVRLALALLMTAVTAACSHAPHPGIEGQRATPPEQSSSPPERRLPDTTGDLGVDQAAPAVPSPAPKELRSAGGDAASGDPLPPRVEARTSPLVRKKRRESLLIESAKPAAASRKAPSVSLKPKEPPARVASAPAVRKAPPPAPPAEKAPPPVSPSVDAPPAEEERAIVVASLPPPAEEKSERPSAPVFVRRGDALAWATLAAESAAKKEEEAKGEGVRSLLAVQDAKMADRLTSVAAAAVPALSVAFLAWFFRLALKGAKSVRRRTAGETPAGWIVPPDELLAEYVTVQSHLRRLYKDAVAEGKKWQEERHRDVVRREGVLYARLSARLDAEDGAQRHILECIDVLRPIEQDGERQENARKELDKHIAALRLDKKKEPPPILLATEAA